MKLGHNATYKHYIRYTTKILKNATVQTRFCTSRYY